MATKSVEEERDAVDHITNSMYSVDFLRAITDVIFSDERGGVTVGGFYDRWFKEAGQKKEIIPFNPGILLAFLYVGILFAKEIWIDLLPTDKLAESDDEWGLKDAKVSAPFNSEPTIRYTVRRIRNSLGHARSIVSIVNVKSREEVLAKATVSFHDVHSQNPSDTFDVTLTLDQLLRLVKKFQSVIHQHVRGKPEQSDATRKA